MTDLDPAAIMAEPLTDVQLRAIAYAAPMFDAGSEEWLMRILRSVQRQAITAHRDRLAAENAALREQIARVRAEISPLRVVYASLPDIPATRRLHRICLRIVAALDGDQPKPGGADMITRRSLATDEPAAL